MLLIFFQECDSFIFKISLASAIRFVFDHNLNYLFISSVRYRVASWLLCSRLLQYSSATRPEGTFYCLNSALWAFRGHNYKYLFHAGPACHIWSGVSNNRWSNTISGFSTLKSRLVCYRKLIIWCIILQLKRIVSKSLSSIAESSKFTICYSIHHCKLS